MKKVLMCLSTDLQPSSFDIITGIDSGADFILPYGSVSESNVKDIVYDCVFTRSKKDLKSIGIFIGGRDVQLTESIGETIKGIFFDDLRVSVALDPMGAYTTATATVLKIKKALHRINGSNSVVLAGTGPIGQNIAVLLAKEGSNVSITSRKLEKAKSVCDLLEKKYSVDIKPSEVKNDSDTERIISNKDIVVSSGAIGIKLLSKYTWIDKNIKILADVNAVPPLGIGGIGPHDDFVEKYNKICFGAIAIGELKMVIHRKIISELFKSNNLFFGLLEIYKLSEKIT